MNIEQSEIRRRRKVYAVVVTVFFLILGARLALISIAGHDLPMADQWYSDVADLEAVVEGDFFRGLLQPHNEHRIFFTRLLNRVLMIMDGQWNSLVQMAASAVVFSAAIAILAGWLFSLWKGGKGAVLIVLLVLLFSLPHAWQNTLWGFQSQFSFLMLFSILSFVLVLRAKKGSDAIGFVGVFSSVASVFCMAAGVINGFAMLTLFVLRAISFGRLSREKWIIALAGVSVLIIGWAVRVDFPGHEWLWAKSVDQFTAVFVASLAWPWGDAPWMFGLMIGPVALLGVSILTRRVTMGPRESAAVLIAAWGIGHAGAFALARGGAAVWSLTAAPRYYDLFAFVVLGSACSLLAILDRLKAVGRWRWFAVVGAIGWFGAIVPGLIRLSTDVFDVQLRGRLTDPYREVRLVTALQEGVGDSVFNELPAIYRFWFPADKVREVSSREELRRWLPPSMQRPIPVFSTRPALRDGADPDWLPTGFYPVVGTWRTDGGFLMGRFESDESIPGRRWYVICVAASRQEAGRIGFIDKARNRDEVLYVDHRGERVWKECYILMDPGEWRMWIEAESDSDWIAVSGPRAVGRIGGPVAWFCRWLRDMLIGVE